MNNNLIIYNISQIVTPTGSSLICGKNMRNLSIIENGYVIIKNGIITKVSSGDSYKEYINDKLKLVNARGLLMLPGFVDSHTHLVHGGSREHELKLKLEGKSYLEILASGGGILSTVKQTKKASFKELYNKAKKSLDLMLKHGVTTVE